MAGLSVACSLLLALAVMAVAGSTPPCDFPAIFNFGDSNSDTGGLSATFGQAKPPCGETFFGKPTGRYCDGRLIVDFIAERFGLPYLSPYLDSIGANFSHGVNFATAGSTVRRLNVTFFQSGFSPISLDVQSSQFTQFKSRSRSLSLQGGVFRELLPKDDVVFSKALYTFDIGQNDLGAGYFLNMSTDEVKAFIPDVIDKFVAEVKSIYGQGGRTFWIHNTGPIGCLPYILYSTPILASQVDRFGCGTPFNDAAKLYNLKLKEAVHQLRKDCPSAAFTYVDVYTPKLTLITQASKYGFEHPLRACCGRGGKYNNKINCGTTMTVNGTKVLVGSSCKEPRKRISWDGVHFTEAANKWVFDQISTGKYSEPPVPLAAACVKRTD